MLVKQKKVLFVSDIHCPYQDEVALEAMYNFMNWWKPDEVIIMGDLVDFYAVSRFNKDPERALRLQEELDSSVSVLKEIRDRAKKANIYFIKGNHENRLKKYLWANASELSSLNALRLESLLEFDKLNIKYKDRGIIRYKDLIVKHGTLVRKFAGYTAKGEFEKNGMSGISVHCFDDKTELLEILDKGKTTNTGIYSLLTRYGNRRYNRPNIVRNDRLYIWKSPVHEYLVSTKPCKNEYLDGITVLSRKDGNSARNPRMLKDIKMFEAF
jgi:predicted phosphodiesterase